MTRSKMQGYTFKGCDPKNRSKVTRDSRANHKGVRAWSGTSLLIALSFMLLSVNAMDQGSGALQMGGRGTSAASTRTQSFSLPNSNIGSHNMNRVHVTPLHVSAGRSRARTNSMTRSHGSSIHSVNLDDSSDESDRLKFQLTIRKNVGLKRKAFRKMLECSYKPRTVELVRDQIQNALYFAFIDGQESETMTFHIKQIKEMENETNYFTGMTAKDNKIVLLELTSRKASNIHNRWLELNAEGVRFLEACQAHSVQFKDNWFQRCDEIDIVEPKSHRPTITDPSSLKDYYHAAANNRYPGDRIVPTPEFTTVKMILSARKSKWIGNKAYEPTTVDAMLSKSTGNLLWFTKGSKKFHITSIGKPNPNKHTVELTTTKHGKKSFNFGNRYLDFNDENNKIFLDFCRRYNVPSEDNWLNYTSKQENSNIDDLVTLPFSPQWERGFYLHALNAANGKKEKLFVYTCHNKVFQPEIVERINRKRDETHKRKISIEKLGDIAAVNRRRLSSLTELLELCEKNGYAQ